MPIYFPIFDEDGNPREDVIGRSFQGAVAFIPNDPENIDWISYLAWLEKDKI